MDSGSSGCTLEFAVFQNTIRNDSVVWRLPQSLKFSLRSMSSESRLESDFCRCPRHCPSTQDSDTAVDGWIMYCRRRHRATSANKRTNDETPTITTISPPWRQRVHYERLRAFAQHVAHIWTSSGDTSGLRVAHLRVWRGFQGQSSGSLTLDWISYLQNSLATRSTWQSRCILRISGKKNSEVSSHQMSQLWSCGVPG